MYLRINIEHQAYFGRVIFFNKGKTFCGVAAFQLSYSRELFRTYVRTNRKLFYMLKNIRTYVYISHGHCYWGRAAPIIRDVKKWVFLKLIFIRTYYYVCKTIVTLFPHTTKNYPATNSARLLRGILGLLFPHGNGRFIIYCLISD